MLGLAPEILALLFVCLLCACAFEFVNGFHDTANAVATVIYTNSLQPQVAVIWSGIWNFIGVMLGGITVAMGIISLIPLDALVDANISHGISLILALLLSAIIWNLGTWYFGLPSSSSHTLIGSILGVATMYSWVSPGNSTVNWEKARETGAALMFSPLLGFAATYLLVILLRNLTHKNHTLFNEPKREVPPPMWIRAILILTCTFVSFFHGNNDGQKGVGLVMLILIVIAPAYFAINTQLNPSQYVEDVRAISALVHKVNPAQLDEKEKAVVLKMDELSNHTILSMQSASREAVSDENSKALASNRFDIRKDVLLIGNAVGKIIKKKHTEGLNEVEVKQLETHVKNVRKLTDYSPIWVTLMISLSLGLGTMIGWKRIVLTIGEKIGKTHLTYAQGAGAELVAATTIGLASQFGLPVSTTHVLSSGIAGSMVATDGSKNLQWSTVRSILMAWVLTFPVSFIMAGGLFFLFHSIFG